VRPSSSAPAVAAPGAVTRTCCRPACGRAAVVTLRFDYAAREVTIDPLAARTGPEAYDLCVRHAARSGAPWGWALRDRAPSRGPATEPAPPVGPPVGHGVDRLAAALCAVPGAVSEDAPDAVPPGADRSVPTRLRDLLTPTAPTARSGPSAPVERIEPVTPTTSPAPASAPRVAKAVRLTPDPRPDVWCADLVPAGPADAHR
jgi:hypothetical protein